MDHFLRIQFKNSTINRMINQAIEVSPNGRGNTTFYNNFKEHKDYIKKISIDDLVISGGASMIKHNNCGVLDTKKNSDQQNSHNYATDKWEYGFNFINGTKAYSRIDLLTFNKQLNRL